MRPWQSHPLRISTTTHTQPEFIPAPSRDLFAARYLRRVGRGYSLLEKKDKDCIFYEPEKGCSVYEVRPSQCRAFPFWPEVVRSPASWEEMQESCPGIGRGPLWDMDEITTIRRESARGPRAKRTGAALEA